MLRAMVGLLHVLQPFVRLWGRLRGTPLPRGHAATPDWTGDRNAWIRALEHDLNRRRCHVRLGSPSEKWDIRASATPVAAAYITTAVMWEWTPQTSVRVRPTLASWCGIVASVAAGIVGEGWWWMTPVAALAVVTVAMMQIGRRVSVALAHTSAGVHA